jgi:hypothetical protein
VQTLEGMDGYPGYLCQRFSLRGKGMLLSQFGSVASVRTFGTMNIRSLVLRADPERGLT